MSSIKKDLAKNTIWNSVERFSNMGIQLLCTFILARYLTPSDYGIIGMLAVFNAVANSFIDSGFGLSLIREKMVSREDYSTILYFNVVLSMFFYIALYLCSGLIADFYNQPILVDLSKVVFLMLPFQAVGLVQNTILQKELKFKKLCIISISSSIISAIVAIIFAYIYENVWALAIQMVLSQFLRSLFLWISTDFVPILKFSKVSFAKYFAFSKDILISGLIGNIIGNIQSILIGKYYSASDLGFYSQADRIKTIASTSTTGVIQNVTYPTLAKVYNDGGDLKGAYKKVIMITILFVGSVMSLLMGISSDLFGILMGSQWREAGVYFLLLGISGLLFPLHSVNQNILLVKGESKKNTLSGNQQEMHYVDYRIHYNTFQRLSICRRFIYIFFSTSFPQPFGMWKAHRLWYMESVKGCFSYFIETDFCNSALPCRFKFYGGYKYLF
ncbi:lipopolysaccharide biosynthesis protein [Parabacteroides distasonis]|nr:lipopolysaccharide biosynthesis protein [Parabacteroides distasonis]